MRTTRIALSAAAAALATGGLVTGLAGPSTAGPADDGGQGVAPRTGSLTSSSVTSCNGGRNKTMQSRIVNTPFQFGEQAVDSADQAVPGAVVTLRGPRRGTDAYLVTFTAETQLTGGSGSGDWMGVEAHVDGSPIQPFSGSNPLALASEPTWNSNSAQFCVRLGRGLHTLRIHANLHDGGGDSALRGWLDDHTTSVLRFN